MKIVERGGAVNAGAHGQTDAALVKQRLDQIDTTLRGHCEREEKTWGATTELSAWAEKP